MFLWTPTLRLLRFSDHVTTTTNTSQQNWVRRTNNLNMSTQIPESELLKPICVKCGTQYDSNTPPANCPICDDPRAYVPPSGQSWTTLKEAISSGKFRNVIEPTPDADGQVYTIITQPRSDTSQPVTQPGLGIGQHAYLIRTPQGNVVWDLVAYLDDETINKIDELGGINAIVISHPHFYTTFATWFYVFGRISVYLASEDEAWVSRSSCSAHKFINEPTREIIPESGITAIKVGGHFPGSMVLHWRDRLFTADSVMVVPSGLYCIDRPEGTVSFSFMWSYPNEIPLPPEAISDIVKAITPFHFEIAHSGFPGKEIKRDAKKKLIQSAQIIISAMHGIQPGEQRKREFWKA